MYNILKLPLYQSAPVSSINRPSSLVKNDLYVKVLKISAGGGLSCSDVAKNVKHDGLFVHQEKLG